MQEASERKRSSSKQSGRVRPSEIHALLARGPLGISRNSRNARVSECFLASAEE